MAKSIDSLDSSGPSEVHSWLKSLSPGLKLERLSTQFENRGFRSRRSLAYVKSEDLDGFFPSPDKLIIVVFLILFYVCREINMLGFICYLFLNEKSSTISIRKRHYSFTGKISRYCTEANNRG